MRATTFALAAAVAVTLATPVLVSASDPEKAASKAASNVSSTTLPASPMVTLKGVKAAPMSSSELADVKGLHVHFWTPGAPFPTEPLLAGDVKTENNWSNLYGQGDVANSYRGLCKAAVNGSAIFINPGGGCGF
jgi:hypothetical protein